MRVIVAGAVAWTDTGRIRQELAQLPPGSTIVHGDAPGADALASEIARELGLLVEACKKEKQDYHKYQRGAWKGLNERMLASGVQLILAFHPDLEKSKGTRHMVEIGRAAGIEVRVIAG